MPEHTDYISNTSEPWQADPLAPLPSDARGLIFDCDGTIVDTMPVHFHAWQEALAAHNIGFDEAHFYRLAGMPTPKIANMLASEHGKADVGPDIAHRKEEAYLRRLDEIQIIEPVVNIVRRCHGHLPMAVASGGMRRVVEAQLQAAGLAHYFPIVVCADDVQYGKPAPDTFLLAAQKMGVPPAECIVYEDGILGFQAAAAAGMRCVDVRPWYFTPGRRG
jgi:beta-phosphoglucomutase family hydrolase